MRIRATIAVVALTFGAITLTAIPAAALDASCGMVITDRGTTVTFTSDLDCGPAPGITIAADDVTIDLGGHFFKGALSNPYGFRISGPIKRPTIENGSVIGFTNALDIHQAFELQLLNLRVKNTAKEAILIADSADMRLDHLVVEGAGDPLDPDFFQYSAINIDRSHHFAISNVTEAGATGTGLHLVTTHDFSVTDSTFANNGASSVYVGFATSNGVMSRIDVSGSGPCFILGPIPDPGAGVSSVSIDHLNAHDCYEAVTFDSVHNASFDAIDVHDNTYGMDVEYDNVNTAITNSRFHDNYATGLAVLGWVGHASTGTRISGNFATNNGESGFSFRGASVDSRNNTAEGNGEAGFAWLNGSGGRSVNDTARSNHLAGFDTNNAGGTALTVSAAASNYNGESGIAAHSGTVRIVGGAFNYNGRDGIEVLSANAILSTPSATKNLHSGVYFSASSAGGASGVTAVKNGYYGIAVVRGSTYVDGGGHTLSLNGIANRCAGVCLA